MSTKDFAEFLAEEMVDSEVNGDLSRPKETTRKRDTRQSTAPEPPKAAHKHVLVKIGKSARTPGRGGGCPAALRDVQEQGVDHLLRRGVRERGYLREWQARVPH
jgi:hypothetical protein